MTENWAIALFGGIFTAMLGVLSSIARGIYKIQDSLEQKVNRDDCLQTRHGYCKRLDIIEEKVNNNITDLKVLKAEIKTEEK